MALTSVQIQEALAARAENPPVSWQELARRFGYTGETVRADIDPAFRAARTKRIREARWARTNGGAAVNASRLRPRMSNSKNLIGRNLEGRNGRTIRRQQKQIAALHGSAGERSPNLPRYGLPKPNAHDEAAPGVPYMENNGCKWILGERRDARGMALCCGNEREIRCVQGQNVTLPWCGEHAARAVTGSYDRTR